MREPIAVVTGASSGLGRGIARALGQKGWIVYVTGRKAGELDKAAAEISAAGGTGIAVICDHADDRQVSELFERVRRDYGHLDMLVNNATAIDLKALPAPGGFWQKPLSLADMMDVGLRSAYVASYYAVPLMIDTPGSLIVHISFYGAVSYHYGPAYGASKAGIDKMSFDMAAELRPHQIASVSVWPGLILTDLIRSIPAEKLPPQLVSDLPRFETPEFTGLVIDSLWRDPERMKLSGETVIAAELGAAYGIRDLDGKQPVSYPELGSPRNRFIFKPER